MYSTKNKQTICIIVDNPFRDLDSSVLLARELTLRQFNVSLVPMYVAGYEIPLIGPDYVLFNYARTNNQDIIKNLNLSGVTIGILDTEGAVWESGEQFSKRIAHKELKSEIKQYFTWGKAQKSLLLKHTVLNPDSIQVTGSPRYDFSSAPLRDCIKEYDLTMTNFILVISNFALSFPRFVSRETEIKNFLDIGYPLQYVETRISDELRAKKELINTISKLTKLFPDQEIVIRIHPFEDEAEYKNYFKNFKTVSIVREGTIAGWLKSAAMVLHLNSSAAVDAVLMKVPTYSLDWVSTDLIRGTSILPISISQILPSFEDLVAVVKNKSHIQFKTSAHANELLSEWFHELDGKAYLRVANQITQMLEAKNQHFDHSSRLRLFFSGCKNKTSAVSLVDSLGLLICGSKIYRWIRNNLLTKRPFTNKKSDKYFDERQVSEILVRLNSIDSNKLIARRTQIENKVLSRALGSSITIRPV